MFESLMMTPGERLVHGRCLIPPEIWESSQALAFCGHALEMNLERTIVLGEFAHYELCALQQPTLSLETST